MRAADELHVDERDIDRLFRVERHARGREVRHGADDVGQRFRGSAANIIE